MELFDRSRLKTEPLSERENKLDINELVANLDKRVVREDGVGYWVYRDGDGEWFKQGEYC